MFEETNKPTNTTKAPYTDYTELVHAGKKYDNLDAMITQIAKERANTAFKSTMLTIKELSLKTKPQELATAMVQANKNMILAYLEEKAKKDAERNQAREMFGL